MSIALREKHESRQGQSGQDDFKTLLYDLTGTADDVAAREAAEEQTPLIFDGLLRQSVHVDPVSVDAVRGVGLWLVTVRYGLNALPQGGDSTFSFDTTGGTQHITQSKQTVNRYAPEGQTAPDFKGAIGVTQDSVEGVDITVPVFSFTVTWSVPVAAMSQAYINGLYALTGKVNDAPFSVTVEGTQLVFAAGECLFLGASGSRRMGDADGMWEITHRFSASPNKTGLSVGDISGIDKKGWEYLWVRYADAEDAAAKTLVKKPTAVYVEKVYEEGDFSALAPGI